MGVTRAAVIGCGDVSIVHFEGIQAIDGIELAAVCDTDPGRGREAAERYGVPWYETHQQMLDAGGVDVVHVTTPHGEHAQPTIDCLAAGVHVIQEKPLAHTLAEGQRIVDAAAAASAKVGVCFQNRYNVSSQELRRILDSGELGEIRGAYASVVWTRTPDYYRNRPWRGTWEGSGGGLMINQAIHTLDLAQWFMGGVESVKGLASTNKYGDVIEVEDTAEFLLRHPGGTETSFYGTLTNPTHRPVEFEVYGENGTASICDGLVVAWADGRIDTYPERAVPSGGRSYWGVSHEILFRDFYATLDDPEPFWITPADAMVSLRALKSLYDQSFETHN